MRLRKLILLGGVLTSLAIQGVFALGLGEITSYSTLNEPFHAEISLTDLKGLNPEEIIVGLGSYDDFARNQLERPLFLDDFRFEVLESPQGPRIKITSHAIIREPFLGFILEARWPNGRVQREYTILLDAPSDISEALD